MICPECSGEWITKRKPWLLGPKRRVCSYCGYIDPRKTWVNDEYCGPPDELTPADIEKKRIERVFFKEDTMPCCGNSPRKAYGGMCMNIECAYCGEKWKYDTFYY